MPFGKMQKKGFLLLDVPQSSFVYSSSLPVDIMIQSNYKFLFPVFDQFHQCIQCIKGFGV
jgi:hypothetical protein